MEDWRSRRAWAGLGLSATVAWLLGHILDLLKSGSVTLWSKLLAIVTFGSHSVRDAPYSTAALDPYPLASLVVTAALAWFPFLSVGFVLAILLGLRKGKTRSDGIRAKLKAAEGESARRALVKRIRVRRHLRMGFAVLNLCILTVGLLVPVGILNQAILVKRLFEADMKIAEPSLSAAERTTFDSRFASMNSKSDFAKVMSELELLSEQRGFKLRPEKVE